MALYHFVAEEKTGIAPTRLVVEKDRVAVGNLVTVNWEGDRVPATILALSGKYMLHPPCLDFVNALLHKCACVYSSDPCILLVHLSMQIISRS